MAQDSFVRSPLAALLVLICTTQLVAQVVDCHDPIADSVLDWDPSGLQGNGGWTYGYYDFSADGDRQYDVDDFQAFTRDPHWRGTVWRLAPFNAPWTEIGIDTGHPNGTNSTPFIEQWAIRRWVSNHDDLPICRRE